MTLIWWLVKLHCSIIVDRLTYEKLWSTDRVSNLLLGIINLGFISITIFHHVYWLIPLVLINTTALAYAVANKNIFQEILLELGFEEKEKILLYQINQLKYKAQFDTNDFFSFTTNQSNVFVFAELSYQENIHTLIFSDLEQ